MSAIVISPTGLSGEVAAPPSKSCAHRAVIAAALASGRSLISNVELSRDIEATVGAVRALGARAEILPGGGGRAAVAVHGIERCADMPVIDCGESGSTLRFMIPVALAACGGAVFTGAGRLGQRPMAPYLDLFRAQCIAAEQGPGGLPLTVRGELKPGVFALPGYVSSQFITGLMLAAPMLPGDSVIRVEGGLESQPYVDVTVDVMGRFGVAVEERERGALYRVAAQRYRPAEYAVEGDWSQAAFLLLMGLVAGPVAVCGLDRASKQGDSVIEQIFRDMGGDIRWEGSRLVARKSVLRGISADVSQCPDLAPAIAAALALAAGEGRITGGKRLRDKESDRISAVSGCLNALGADVTETDDGMVFSGKPGLALGECASAGDHRIAMMAAAISGACGGPVTLEGWEAVSKSWPGFWDTFRELGGRTDG